MEFQEITEIVYQICAEHDANCKGCPFYNTGLGCQNLIDMRNSPVWERVCGQWKEKHRAHFPTWKQWQRQNFPKATEGFCPQAFDGEYVVCGRRCSECVKMEIPFDITKKLNIEPISEEDVQCK